MLHISSHENSGKNPAKSAEHAGKIPKSAKRAQKARRPACGSDRQKEKPQDLWRVDGLAEAEEPPELARSLPEFLRAAADLNNRSFETVHPNGSDWRGNYRSPCCLFVAFLKSRDEFRDLSGHEAALLVEETFPESQDPWEDLDLPDHDTFGNGLDPRDDVIDQWEKITRPADLETPSLDIATELATKYPLLSSRYRSPRDQPYRQLVAICYWLARLYRGEPFFLSFRVAGERLGVSHVQAGRYISRAKEEHLLIEQTSKSARSWSSGRTLPANRLAREYKFNFDTVDG